MLIRAIVETVDTSNATADIRPLDHPAALFTACPVLESCPIETLAADVTVLAQTFDDGTAVILGAYGAAPRGAGYVCVIDQKSSGTNGGTFTTGAWRTRTLNTEQADTDGLCSLSSNQITLAAGVYRCHISCPAWDVLSHQARLYNVTATALVLQGTTAYTNPSAWSGGVQSRSFIIGQFTIAAAQALEVQHRGGQTANTYGFGPSSSMGAETYTVAEFWRLHP